MGLGARQAHSASLMRSDSACKAHTCAIPSQGGLPSPIFCYPKSCFFFLPVVALPTNLPKFRLGYCPVLGFGRPGCQDGVRVLYLWQITSQFPGRVGLNLPHKKEGNNEIRCGSRRTASPMATRNCLPPLTCLFGGSGDTGEPRKVW